MKKVLPYLITAAIGAAIAILIMFAVYRVHTYAPTAENAKNIMKILSDSFFVPGVILSGVGLIIFASNGGAFDILAFAFIRFFDLLRKDVKGKYKDYYEYRQAKKDRHTKMFFMLAVGLVFIAIAVVFLIVYYNI